MTDIPHVLDALSAIVDDLNMEGRIAIDLPHDYDWQRVDMLLGHLTRLELEVFCIGTDQEKAAIVEEYGEEAVYAQQALHVLRVKLEEGKGGESKKQKGKGGKPKSKEK